MRYEPALCEVFDWTRHQGSRRLALWALLSLCPSLVARCTACPALCVPACNLCAHVCGRVDTQL